MSTAQSSEVAERRPASSVRKDEKGRTMADVEINHELCKACWLCVHACPEKVLTMSKEINRRGYRFALYTGTGCTGCGVCYYTCPEPSTIVVQRGVRAK